MMDQPTTRVRVRTLEARVAQGCVALDARFGRTEVDVMEDHAANQLVLRLKAFVYGEKLGEKSVQYPADWLQAVKERFAPDWAKARWPVRYRTVTVRAFASYPEFRPAPNLGPVVRTYEMVVSE